MENDAVEPLSATVPSVVAPSRKVMLPVGAPELADVVAVRTMLAPTFAGFGETVRVVTVAGLVGVPPPPPEPEPELAPLHPQMRPTAGKKRREAKAIGRNVIGDPRSLVYFALTNISIVTWFVKLRSV